MTTPVDKNAIPLDAGNWHPCDTLKAWETGKTVRNVVDANYIDLLADYHREQGREDRRPRARYRGCPSTRAARRHAPLPNGYYWSRQGRRNIKRCKDALMPIFST